MFREAWGWATVGGPCTGSADQNPVVVSSLDDLRAALKQARNNTKKKGAALMTIYISGTIDTPSPIYLQDTKQLSVYGLPGSALVNHWRDKKTATNNTGVLHIKRCQNVILRNLTLKSAGAYDIDGNDNMTVSQCRNLWIDHCDIQDGVDGNLDIGNHSDHITVSWCRFRYFIAPKAGGSGGSDNHRFSNLVGSSDKADDEGQLGITYACCWWDEGCVARMPRVRFGRVHLVNCLYSSGVTNYCIGVGYKAHVYAENCVFDLPNKKSHPWKFASHSGEEAFSYVFKGCVGLPDDQRQNQEPYFTPADFYQFSVLPASEVRTAVTNSENGAGATLKFHVL